MVREVVGLVRTRLRAKARMLALTSAIPPTDIHSAESTIAHVCPTENAWTGIIKYDLTNQHPLKKGVASRDCKGIHFFSRVI